MGCATLRHEKSSPAKEAPGADVQRVATLWTAAHAPQAGKVVPGFAGKVFLMGGAGFRPIQARGRLVIYAFEDSPSGSHDVVAARRWEFSADELSGHVEQTMLGWAYVFWLPWDTSEKPPATMSLQVAFVPEGEDESRPVVGPAVRVVLPEPDGGLTHPGGEGADADSPLDPSPEAGIETHTIPLESKPGSLLPVVKSSDVRATRRGSDQPPGKTPPPTASNSGNVAGSVRPNLDHGQLISNRRYTGLEPRDRFREKPLVLGRDAAFQNDRRAVLADRDGSEGKNVRIGHPRRQSGSNSVRLRGGELEPDSETGSK